jgi:hypothetical protein
MHDRDIITALGPRRNLAEDLTRATGVAISRDAVDKWVERERISLSWRPWVLRLARQRGILSDRDIDPPLPRPREAA